MKRILLYLLLVVSLAVFAQTQPGSDEEPQVQTEHPEDELDVLEDLPGDSPEESDDPVAADVEGSSEESQEGADEAGPDDVDFKPTEEISEDFPVPLPSDI